MSITQIVGLILLGGLGILILVTWGFTKTKTFEGASAAESNNLFIQMIRYMRQNAFDIEYVQKHKEMQEEKEEIGRYNALKLSLISTFEDELSRPHEEQFIYEVDTTHEYSQEVYKILEDMMNSKKSIYDIDYNDEEDLFLIKYKQVI